MIDKPGHRLNQLGTASGRGAAIFLLLMCALSGEAAEFPAQMELSSLSTGFGLDGFILNGIDGTPPPNDLSGAWVSGAGDLNGDGIADIVIGATGGSPGGRAFAGQSYVIYGRVPGLFDPFTPEFELSDLLTGNGVAGFVINGVDAGDTASLPVATAGDLNHDGVDDLLVGAPYAGPGDRANAGEAYVLFGRQTAIVGNFPSQFELADLLPENGGDGSAGFVIAGVAAGDEMGRRLAAAGDVNGDGVDDILLGAWRADAGAIEDAGAVYVVFGRDTATGASFPAQLELSTLAASDGSTGFVLLGVDSFDRAGSAVAGIGDVNHDSFDDLLIGAELADPVGLSVAGEAYVVLGRDAAVDGNFPATFELASLAAGDGSAGFLLEGADTGDRTGAALCAAGDLNGDGIADFAIGARFAAPEGRLAAGNTYVIFGRNAPLSGNFPARIALADIANGDGSMGFNASGIDNDDKSASSVGYAGDINGDGIDDLVIGADGGDPNGNTDAGETYVVFGRDTVSTGDFPARLQLASLAAGDGSTGFVMNGIDASDISGRSVNGAGDFNNDGVDDVLIGAPWGDPNNQFSGETYLVLGRRDSDGDNVHDAADNCLFIANPAQVDADADGLGNRCDADLNNDCSVNTQDLGLMKLAFFSTDEVADLDVDGVVNVVDLGIMKAQFFGPPGPSGTANLCDAW